MQVSSFQPPFLCLLLVGGKAGFGWLRTGLILTLKPVGRRNLHVLGGLGFEHVALPPASYEARDFFEERKKHGVLSFVDQGVICLRFREHRCEGRVQIAGVEPWPIFNLQRSCPNTHTHTHTHTSHQFGEPQILVGIRRRRIFSKSGRRGWLIFRSEKIPFAKRDIHHIAQL